MADGNPAETAGHSHHSHLLATPSDIAVHAKPRVAAPRHAGRCRTGEKEKYQSPSAAELPRKTERSRIPPSLVEKNLSRWHQRSIRQRDRNARAQRRVLCDTRQMRFYGGMVFAGRWNNASALFWGRDHLGCNPFSNRLIAC